MTTFATVAGLAPLVFRIGAGAELQRPLALAVIGGLIFSTAVSLFVTPALVDLAFRRRPPRSAATPGR
jgi:HAE1 family hydrophobic/amphiphilic exporter-1